MTDRLDEVAGSVLLATAAAFVAAQPDGPARLSALHHRQPNGLCAGCLATPTRWPCGAARIAAVARTVAPLRREPVPRRTRSAHNTRNDSMSQNASSGTPTGGYPGVHAGEEPLCS